MREIASSPLPALPPSDERHFNQCIRIMSAALPKRAVDDVSGELLLGIYQRQLGAYSNEEISFLTDQATRTRKWFPTIAECIEIIGKWRRDDEALRRKFKARDLVAAEERKREQERLVVPPDAPRIPQNEINQMPLEMRQLGLKIGHITQEQFDIAATKDEPDAQD